MAALLAIGAIFCAGSLIVLVRRAMLIRGVIQASGVVIRIETVYEARTVGIFERILLPRDVPIVHFETGDDVDVVARLPPTSWGQYSCGQWVSFLYHPRDPHDIVMSRVDYWCDLIPFFLIGMLCFASVLWLR